MALNGFLRSAKVNPAVTFPFSFLPPVHFLIPAVIAAGYISAAKNILPANNANDLN